MTVDVESQIAAYARWIEERAGAPMSRSGATASSSIVVTTADSTEFALGVGPSGDDGGDHRRLRWLLLAACVMLALGGLVYAIGRRPSEPTIPATQLEDPFTGSWESGADGSRDVLEVRRSDASDSYQIVIRYRAAAACSGEGAVMTGSGGRETGSGWRPGLVELVMAAEVTCADGSPPSFERGQRAALVSVRFVHDAVTGELIGPTTAPGEFDAVDEHSFERAWRRVGMEVGQVDPSSTIDRLVNAVNAADVDAFKSVFAPDGGFQPRERFEGFLLGGDPLLISDPRVATWMQVPDAWGFEAELRDCRSLDPETFLAEARGLYRFSASSDTWIDCDVAARWTKLSLEIIDEWRFELRGARVVGWQQFEVVDLDPAARTLPLGYPGIEAWEAWLETTHPADATRLLAPRGPATAPAVGCDDPETMCGFAEQGWVIDGHRFTPTNLIPYDPALADEIQASIHEYLDSQ